MIELFELLLELALDNPVIGVTVIILPGSLICFMLIGSVVPVVCGVLIALLVRWLLSRRNLTTLNL